MNTRRNFLKLMSSATIIGGHPTLSALNSTKSRGRYLITVQAQGGWDVTCFCDPKENMVGEKEITHWSRDNETAYEGGIAYAPFAQNEQFFKKHADKTLIINGVDTQTNSHSTGVIVSWSGRTAGGFPSITALNSAVNGPGLSMSYINFGVFGNTERLVRSTILSGGVEELAQLLKPNPPRSHTPHAIDPELWGLIRRLNVQDAAEYYADERLIAGNKAVARAYIQSMTNVDPLIEFSSKLGNANDWAFADDEYLKKQALFAISAFGAGVSVSADLRAPGDWDSHKDNDIGQTDSFTQLTSGLDYLWDLAEAAGIADELVVVVGSDFSRTPHYNADDGKDHWAVGSYMIMEKNTRFTNRTIGATDEGHNTLKIDPETLKVSNFGSTIYTSNVHESLREHLGLSNDVFAFNNDENFTFFTG
jgi:hypothetical protein